MFSFIQYLTVQPDGTLPEIPNCLYAYIAAGNGLFVHAKRPGLEVLIPATECRIAGLPELTPSVKVEKRVPVSALGDILHISRGCFPHEALFWFNWGEEWLINIPEQTTRVASVVPCDRNDPAGTSALMDLHSHGGLRPFFSPIDDKDETGFRIYAVIGNVDTEPEICVRVGVYKNYFDIPADLVFEMPNGITDVYDKEYEEVL
jgi:PRTRC genetic system protein A